MSNKENELLNQIEKLKNEIKNLKDRKKYGLVWEDKPEQVVLDCQDKLPIIKEVKNKEIKTDKNKPVNILIEGDNYHSLSVLNYTHRNKIDVIYIDPPYNTGNKDFIYNDKFIDRDDSYRHSKWLSFMNKRLLLARDLLKDDGVIFISIDDNEQANLKLLCNDIFGRENFLGQIVQNKGNAQNDAKNIQKNHEYHLVFCKSRKIKNGKEYHLIYDVVKKDKAVFQDEGGHYFIGSGLTTGGAGGTLNARPNLGWSIYYNEKTGDFFGLDDYNHDLAKTSNDEDAVYKDNKRFLKKGYVIIRPPKKGAKLGCWTWGIERFNKNKNIIFIKKTRAGFSVNKKKYIEPGKDIVAISALKSVVDFSTSQGTVAVSSIFGSKVFNNAKNIELIKYFINSHPNKLSTTLDFFAGSGTTGHAVLDLNKEDGGSRQFILCTNNENKIAEDVCYPRISKVIKGYKDQKGKKIEGLGGNLKYYRTSFVDSEHINKISDDSKVELAHQAGEVMALRENTLYEVEKNEWWQIFTDGKKQTAIYFQEDKSELPNLLEKLPKKSKVALYIFTWGKDEYKNEFLHYENIRIHDIPEPILEVYRSLNKL